jgi:hypothetical protein
MGGIVKEHKGHLLEIGGIANHVHLLVSLSNLNSYSDYSDLIRDVIPKGIRWPNPQLYANLAVPACFASWILWAPFGFNS